MAWPCKRQVPDFQNQIASWVARSKIERFDIATDHEFGNFAGCCFFGVSGGDELTVSQHGDTIREMEYFVHLVRDVQDGCSLATEFCDDAIETFDFGFGQSASRFVHNQNPAIDAQRFGNLDELLITNS